MSFWFSRPDTRGLPPPEMKVEKSEENETGYYIIERSASRYHTEYVVVRNVPTTTKKEYASCIDKENAETIAAFLNEKENASN